MIQSPKNQLNSKQFNIYPYYAGFGEKFVQSWIELISPNKGDTVLDPWNGSGTTTAVCAKNGIKSTGIDLNPFMKAVALARVADPGRWQLLSRKMDEKRIRFAKQSVPIDEVSTFVFGEVFGSFTPADIDYWLAMFIIGASLRRHSVSALSKNPTWFSVKRLRSLKISGQVLFDSAASIRDEMELFSNHQKGNIRIYPELISEDVTTYNLGSSVNHVLTSPPYLTRIDYAQKTLPETLFALSMTGGKLKDLRRDMMGSVLTERVDKSKIRGTTKGIDRVLSKVENHDSKASSTYYARFFSKYFWSLHKSLSNIGNSVCKDGSITLVTQGSYYKEEFIDLPEIVNELMEGLGWELKADASFRASNSLAQVNRRSYASTQKPPNEVVQVFGKCDES